MKTEHVLSKDEILTQLLYIQIFEYSIYSTLTMKPKHYSYMKTEAE